MAQGATVCKVEVAISNLDTGYYDTRVMTFARHPSETDARVMVRILAFCLYATDRTEFAAGLSAGDLESIAEKNDFGGYARWIDIGVPDVKSLRKAAGVSDEVAVVAYHQDRIGPWWTSNRSEFDRIDKLEILSIRDEDLEQLRLHYARSMKLSVTIQDGAIWLADDAGCLELTLSSLKRRGERIY